MRGRLLSWKALAGALTLAGLLASPRAASANDADLKKLAAALATKLKAQGKTRVLVVDFKNLDDTVDALGKYVAQKFGTLAAEEGLIVIDRSQVQQLYAEIERADDGILDPTTARSMGKQSGIEVVVSGWVDPRTVTVKVDARATDLETSSLLASATQAVTRVGAIDRVMLKAAEEAASGTVAPGSAAAAPPSPPKPKQAVRTTTVSSIRFDLEGCEFEGDSLTCSAQVTNLGKERELYFTCGSHAWDEEGNEYKPEQLRLANAEAGCKKSYEHALARTLVPGLSTRLAVLYRGVRPDLQSVPQFRIVFLGKNSEPETIAFRDIVPGGGTAVAGGSSAYALGAAGAVQAKKDEGFLRRMGRRLLASVEEVGTRKLDEEAKKATGEDEEAGQGKPPQ